MATVRVKQPSLWEAIGLLGLVMSGLGMSLYYFGDAAGEGANQVVLLLGAGLAWGLGWRRGVSFKVMWEATRRHLLAIWPTVLFLLAVGSMTAMWLLAGITPGVIYYGVTWLSPRYFLVAAVLFSAVVAVVTGSSWATIGTVGVALLGIGRVLGLPEAVVAGAVISGAYFGDKISPLSETTLMASSVAGVSLRRHIIAMLVTSIPTLGLALCLFFWQGMSGGGADEGFLEKVAGTRTGLEALVVMSPWLFVVPGLVMLAIALGVSPVLTLCFGALLGGGVTLVWQPSSLGDASGLWQGLWALVRGAVGGVDLAGEGAGDLGDLLRTGGMVGMWPTVALMMGAVFLGGAMEGAGILGVLQPSGLQSRRGLVGVVLLTCLFFNIAVADQYLAILLTGKLYGPLFKKRGIKGEYLSRTLEDGATVTSPLIPWNTCGAAQAGVLGVPTLEYAPYCYFNLLNPLLSWLLSIPEEERE